MMIRSLRYYSTKFKAGDLVVIQPFVKTASEKMWLSKPLQVDGQAHTNTGPIPHNDIIGSYPRSKIFKSTGKKASEFILSRPTTEDYINLIARNAQPIYPFDAAAITALADLHIDYPELDTDGLLASPPLQFFEAGTGHGSLALQIAKTIHSANCYARGPDGEDRLHLRGAILHSIDCSEKHSLTGTSTVQRFKNGMYKNDVLFHVSESPTKWLDDECSSWWDLSKPDEELLEVESESAFLSGAFLDMGGFEKHIKSVAGRLKLDAPLVIFCPSVTQILDALQTVDADPSMKLQFHKTVQLLDGAGGGLKEWDTRKTYVRATKEAAWVCRPKVGIRVCGGGFVIIFRKLAKQVDQATGRIISDQQTSVEVESISQETASDETSTVEDSSEDSAILDDEVATEMEASNQAEQSTLIDDSEALKNEVLSNTEIETEPSVQNKEPTSPDVEPSLPDTGANGNSSSSNNQL